MKKVKITPEFANELKLSVNGDSTFTEYVVDRYACVINDSNRPLMLFQHIYNHFGGTIDGIALDDDRGLIQSGVTLFDEEEYVGEDYVNDTMKGRLAIFGEDGDNDRGFTIELTVKFYEPDIVDLRNILMLDSVFSGFDMDYVIEVVNIERV